MAARRQRRATGDSELFLAPKKDAGFDKLHREPETIKNDKEDQTFCDAPSRRVSHHLPRGPFGKGHDETLWAVSIFQEHDRAQERQLVDPCESGQIEL